MFEEFKSLIGAGGLFGKPKQKSYTSAPDTGRTVSYGQVIELICSGGKYGIGGLKTDNGDVRKGVCIDDTAIIASDGTENFKGIEIFQRKGAPAQLPIESFNSEIVSEESVGTEVKASNPVTRAFINENCTAVRVRLAFTLLKNVKDGSNVIGTEATEIIFRVLIKEGAGAFVQRAQITVRGKYSEPYEKIYFYTVNPSVDEYYIRIERVTGADTEDFKRVISWQSFSVIVETILPFKRIAYSGIKFNAEDFGLSIPERKYRIDAMLLDIPTNSTLQPDGGLLFSGNWDGLFKAELSGGCCDYGCILWYLLTDEIDGLGEEIKPYMIDRFSLFEISRYNNELVPDGYGGRERRYLFNGVINKQTDGWKMIDSILSGCNARKVWENGVLRFIQDRPKNIRAVVSNADVDKGIFSYADTHLDECSTAVQVTWTDTLIGKTRQAYYSDARLIAKNGYRKKEIESIGCHRRSQAMRIARAVVISENTELETVTFTCRNYISYIPIGEVISISDSNLFDKRLAGLICAGSTSRRIVIDYPVQISDVNGFDEQFYLLLYPDVREAIRIGVIATGYDHWIQHGQSEGRRSNGYLLMCLLPSLELEIRYVLNPQGVYTVLMVETPFSQAPDIESTFVLISPEIPLKLYRIESKDIDDSNPDAIAITCKEYNPYKWEKIELGVSLGTKKPTITLPTTPNAPTDLKAVVYVQGDIRNLDISWKQPLNGIGVTDTNVVRYFISWKLTTETNFGAEIEVNTNIYTLALNILGIYVFRVRAETFNNLSSQYSYSPDTVLE